MPSDGRLRTGLSWGIPAPLPEELASSVLARYLRNWAYLDATALLKRTVTVGHRHLNGLCPPGIQSLAIAVSERGLAHQMILRHSLLPYVLMYEPRKIADQVAREVSTNKAASYRRLHLTALRSIHAPSLRYCPECAADDRAQFSEPYWHRVHQLSFASRCPSHQISLRETPVPFVASSALKLSAASSALSHGVHSSATPLLRPSLEDALAAEVVHHFERGRIGAVWRSRPSYRQLLFRLGYGNRRDELFATRLVDDLKSFLSIDEKREHCIGRRDWWRPLTTAVPGVTTPLQHQLFRQFLHERIRQECSSTFDLPVTALLQGD